MEEEGLEPGQGAGIKTYLGLMLDRLGDYNSNICHWHTTGEKIGHTYARQALPMMWHFAELNPFGGAAGNITGALEWILGVLQHLVNSSQPAYVYRTSASHLALESERLATGGTEPP